MRIVLIGAGRLATNLALALHHAGHQLLAVYSRTMTAATALAVRVGAQPTDSLASLPAEADLFILSVKDTALESVFAQAVQGRAGQFFVHTAGSMPMSLFEGHPCRYGVFYPMQTFSKERLVDFAEIPVFLEASDAASLQLLKTLAASISHRIYELSSADRKYLHLAAVFACNFANHCYALSAKILEQHGLPFSVMLPLIDETARKVHELHPLDAQTGPAVRYDENVISMQQRLLDDEEMRRVYELLSKSIYHQTQ